MFTPLLVLVDDDPDDRMLFAAAHAECATRTDLRVFGGGPALLAWLGESPHRQAPPCCVLLDLNMPVMTGWDVLKRLKGSPQTAPIPVVIYSTSSDPEDMRRAQKEGAASYITKPRRLAGLFRVVDELELAWAAPSTR